MTNLVTDPQFDQNKTEQYTLSIRISPGGFSFIIIDQNINKLLALYREEAVVHFETSITRKFQEFIDRHPIFKKRFANTDIFYSTTEMTIIPGSLYSFKQQDKLADFIFTRNRDNRTIDNYLSNIKANFIFTAPEKLIELADDSFSQYRLIHPIAHIINKSNLNDDHPVLTILLYHSHLFLHLTDRQKLIFVNSYNYKHPDDCIYFSHSIFKQNNIDITKCRLKLAGTIEKNDLLYSSLDKHFPDISFFNPTVTVNPDYFNFPAHNFVSLL